MKTFLGSKKTMIILVFLMSFFSLNTAYAVNGVSQTGLEYIEFREIDRGTYNEYRYKMTEKYFEIREGFQVNKTMDKTKLLELSQLAKTGYAYLPDNLANKNLYSEFETYLKQALNNERSDSTFNKMVAALQDYIEEAFVYRMTGDIEVTPREGNAPLNTTLRANITDPTGVEIPSYNYVWWIDMGGEKKILGRANYINYTFTEEGNYSIFLGVVSNHKNTSGNNDVLPFFGKADIRVKEKVASVIIKVNSASLGTSDDLKFDSEDAKYGLLFDATSSTPNSGMKFVETSWNFGNGIERTYEGSPRVEKVPYINNGTYKVSLKLKTNSGKMVQRDFTIYINHPAATIRSSKDDGYIGDKFTFSSKSFRKAEENINYSWEIIDINQDKVIHTKNSNLFNYVFTEKGRYNIKLKITLPSGKEDVDTKIIYINSRSPKADFRTKIPYSNTPNKVFIDGSRSYDPDIGDDGKLTFQWTIDGERVELNDANENGSVGYYTFDSIGEHSISLEVMDPDNMPGVKTGKVQITSLLDVDFVSAPIAVQRDGTINFFGDSRGARYYEWDFGDGVKDYGNKKNVSHTYSKSGVFQVTLKVTDDQNKTNSISKKVFVGKSNSPVALFSLTTNRSEMLEYDESACGGRGAYIADKLHSITFNGKESIDLDGSKDGLSYSWRIGLNKYETTAAPNYKFDELGCFPVKLTVVSKQNKSSDSIEEYVDVRNILPSLSSLSITSTDEESDPIIFNIKAIGAKDPDGVIQSYLWYYYTDYDTEAQGFKTTPNPETSFVLPRITGTYFFGVVLKDNNEEKFLSEDVGKFFRTISSDNSNTPLIELKVLDNSVAINDEVVFTAKVKNIIGRDLSNSVDYYWDFDGDGFFEKKGKTPTVSYKYKKSGTFFPKLKVKYRGLSNVRNLTIDVSNKLEADFDYISIGNKFIFLDKSQGKIDSATWDFGDGATSDVVGDVVHKFQGASRSHRVKLTIREGTKQESVEKEIISNMKNIIRARKTGVNLFSSPIIENDVMTLSDSDEKVTIYPGESSGENDIEVAFYAVDYDIETDSDLNGGKDDDRDNVNTPSYRNGTPVHIELNDNKVQKVRVFTLDADEKLIHSYDFQIEKTYIIEEEIDLDSIVFEGATDKEKQKIEQLKILLSDLPADQRLPAMKYVQKLQEDWFDARGKTDVIVEMQMYLSQISEYDPSEVNELLESFLIEDTADKGEREVAFNALKNLIPANVTCSDKGEFETCTEMLHTKLESIKNSNNLEENKKTGEEILEIIGLQSKDLMTTDSKIRFKEVLKTYVYGGITNIPEEELAEIQPPELNGGQKSLGLLKWILYATAIILGLILLGLIIFFIFYKLNNKDKNVEFQDFIIEKTSGKGSGETNLDVLGDVEENDDALASINFDEPKNEKHEKIEKKSQKEDKNSDPFAPDVSTTQKTKNITANQKDESIQSWLGDSSKTSQGKRTSVQGKKIKDEKDETTNAGNTESKKDTTPTVPSWLQGADTKKTTNARDTEKKQKDVSKDIRDPFVDKNTGLPEIKESKKSDFSKDVQTLGKPRQHETETPTKTEETKEINSPDNKTFKDEADVPAWLKGSLEKREKDKNQEKDVQQDQKTQKKDLKELPKKDTSEVSDTQIVAKSDVKKDANSSKNKVKTVQKDSKNSVKKDETPVKKETKVPEKITKDQSIKKGEKDNLDDLDEITKLDDGIPDWLKGSFDAPKKQKSDVKEEKIQSETKIKSPVINDKVPKKEINEPQAKAPDPVEKKSFEEKVVKTPLAPEKKQDISKTQTKTTQQTKSTQKEDKKNLGENALWEDGMDIPDWLKSGDK